MSLTSNTEISDYFQLTKQKENKMGVELEYEGVLDKFNKKGWGYYFKTTKDGSLRDKGLEFVSAPLPYKDLVLALKRIYRYLVKKHGFKTSYRTSMHVHVGVSNLTAGQLVSSVLMWLALEPYILSSVPKSRRFNTFSMPLLSQSEWFLSEMKSDSFEYFSLFGCTRRSKYLSLSFNRLRDLGTVELRCFQAPSEKGDCTIDQAAGWVGFCHQLFQVFPVEKSLQITLDFLRDHYLNDKGLENLLEFVNFKNRDLFVTESDSCSVLNSVAETEMFILMEKIRKELTR